MTEVKKLYKVVREHVYNGGRGREEVQSTEVLYCGYDRDEARRVYHQHNIPSRCAGPGNYYYQVRCLSLKIKD